MGLSQWGHDFRFPDLKQAIHLRDVSKNGMYYLKCMKLKPFDLFKQTEVASQNRKIL